MKIRLLELCAGYGSQALALKNLGIDVYSEIAEFDKYASQAYMQLHGETKNYGDIYTIDETKLPYFDMITYSTPCQDFSVAGKGKGGDKGSGTRSSLLWECERIIRAVKPKYLLMENVKNLLSQKHRHNFNEWFKVLESMGYKNYYKVLNAKDYGIPQNRERIFCVSILGGGQYLFPNPIPLEKRLKDIIEENVPEKYYLSDEQIKIFLQTREPKTKEISNSVRCGGRGSTLERHDWDIIVEPLHIKEATLKGYTEANEYDSVSLDLPNSKTRRGRVGKQISNTLTCSCNMGVVEPKVIQVGQIYPNSGKPQAGRIYDEKGISPAMDTCSGGNRMPKIIQNSKEFNKDGNYKDNNFIVERTPLKFLDRNGKKVDGDYSFCVDTAQTGGIKEIYNNFYRIRKLTPRECWRLMGVKDEQFDRLHGLSDSRLYKMAGNSIVVDVLEAIFRNLLMPETTDTKGQLNLF